jgi:hypothetical protein
VVETFRRSRSRDGQAAASQVADQRQSVSRQPRAAEDATGRQERMRRRAVEMLGTQPMTDARLAELEASRPKCKHANLEPPVRQNNHYYFADNGHANSRRAGLKVFQTLFPLFR